MLSRTIGLISFARFRVQRSRERSFPFRSETTPSSFFPSSPQIYVLLFFVRMGESCQLLGTLQFGIFASPQRRILSGRAPLPRLFLFSILSKKLFLPLLPADFPELGRGSRGALHLSFLSPTSLLRPFVRFESRIFLLLIDERFPPPRSSDHVPIVLLDLIAVPSVAVLE